MALAAPAIDVKSLHPDRSYGRASDGFRNLVRDLRPFHDLRASAVVRLARAEATEHEIATFTGHSLKDVEAILDAHDLGGDVRLAEAAVSKLEKRTET